MGSHDIVRIKMTVNDQFGHAGEIKTIPRHMAELVVNRGAAVYIDEQVFDGKRVKARQVENKAMSAGG